MKQTFSNPAFQSPKGSPVGFNIVTTSTTFHSVFDPKPLDPEEEIRIQKLLMENSSSDQSLSNEKISEDFNQIKTLTAEIKAIQKQGLILMGERIEKAREILKSYKEGTFTQWLKEAFKSKQTGYNILAYYEFYKSLPTLELKELFKRLPQKAAYALASREGEIDVKVDILRNPSIFNTEDLILQIREKLPLSKNDRRQTKGFSTVLVDTIYREILTLSKRSDPLTEDAKDKLMAIKMLIEEMLSSE